MAICIGSMVFLSRAAVADGSLDTRASGQGVINRVLLDLDGASQQELVLVFWGNWFAGHPQPEVRAAAQLPFLFAGPVTVSGGLAEIRNPHPRTVRFADARESSLEIDRTLEPARMAGFGVTPIRGRLTLAGMSGAAARHAVVIVQSPAGVRFQLTEFIVVGTGPVPADPITPAADGRSDGDLQRPWFGEPAYSVPIVHSLFRSVIRAPWDAEVGLAAGVSLSPWIFPGTWVRMFLHSSGFAARTSFTSPQFLTTDAARPETGASMACSIRRSPREWLEWNLNGCVRMGWNPIMDLPGAPFTLRGLELRSAAADGGISLRSGTADMAVTADLLKESHAAAAQLPVVRAGIEAGVELGFRKSVIEPRVSARCSIDESVDLLLRGQLAAEVHGRHWSLDLDLSATADAPAGGPPSWEFGVAGAAKRAGGQTTFARISWKSNGNASWKWSGEIGHSTR